MKIRNRELSCRTVVSLTLLVFVIGIVAGVFGWIWISGGAGQPSRSIEEALAELEATNQAANAELAVIIPAAVGTAVSEALDSAMSETAVETVDGGVEFQIVPAESQATFTLKEDLRGTRTTVIGATSEVAGKIMVNLDNPAASAIGAIVINARALETDNSFRNRALRSSILKSAQDAYEFITFEPQALSNFSAESVSVGETLTFDITGSLTIADATQSLTFNAAVTLESETRISGRATANVLHADYDLVIPEVPSVANVTDDVDLAIHFVAVADD